MLTWYAETAYLSGDLDFTIFGTDIFENRKHVHVGRRGTVKRKIWLEPDIDVAEPGDLSVREQREVLEITALYKADLIWQWEQFLTGQKIEIIKIQ